MFLSNADILAAVIQQLQHQKPVIRKKAAACLGALAATSSDALLHRMVANLLAEIESGGGPGPRALTLAMGTLTRSVGSRLGRHLARIVPLFLQFCGDPASSEEAQHCDAANELRESCLPGLLPNCLPSPCACLPPAAHPNPALP